MSDLQKLTERDIRLCQAMAKWVDTVQRAGDEGPDWYPTYANIIKSRLFERIRSGKDPLPYAPPCSYSYPWYEVIEQPGPHQCIEPIYIDLQCNDVVHAVINQCPYLCLEDPMLTPGAKMLLGFGPYRFLAWNDAQTHRGWIERAVDQEDLEIPAPQIETTALPDIARSYMSSTWGALPVPHPKSSRAILGGHISGPRRR